MAYYEALEEAAGTIRARTREVPRAAIVLGSGLSDVAQELTAAVSIPYTDLPHWPRSTVAGHDGRLIVGTMRGRTVAALAGRAHLYEGYAPEAVVFGVRTLVMLGVQTILLTNAAGGVNHRLAPGTLMVVDDHINLTGANPLVGMIDARLGPPFPDMSEVYSRRLRRIADEAAGAAGLPVEHGVYAALLGPSYETPAEVRYLRAIGADAVGMSTVLEAIAARHMGADVLAVSCITNMAAGAQAQPLSHEDVIATAARVRGGFVRLLEGIVDRL